MITTLLTILFATLSVLGALLVLWTSRVHYAALGLLGALLGIALLYGLQGATFVSAAYLLIQVGGVLLLLLFGALFTGRSVVVIPKRVRLAQGMLLAIWIGFCFSLSYVEDCGLGNVLAREATDPVAVLGMQLVGQYNIGLEFTGVVLLVALVGAIYVLAPVHRS